ncbi:MAG TPA: hypothetical protein VN281_00075 [Verrucomicrobiae bacterium]|nr:hypothetical protein [Verrucomicrobiae bacterium]
MRNSNPQMPASIQDAATKRQIMALAVESTLGEACPSLRAALLMVCCCLMFAGSARAQFSIDWFKVAGGGGTSTNSIYSVSGTIGQLDAGTPMTNGQFSVTGGFWVLPAAVQSPGAPTLTIAPGSPGQAVISWTPNPPGFVLQETLTLSPPNWTNSASGSTNPVTINALAPTRFYRLFKP